jgi:archaellum component FlaC
MISGQVTGIGIDDHGNIKVTTEYTLTDGSKSIGNTRYSFENFSKAKILEDVKSQCENLMRKVYTLKANQELIKTKVDDISYECESVELTTKQAITDITGNILTPKETITIDDK